MSAEPAAVFAALLAFGSRNTFEAAEAAFALVTSVFDFLGILFTYFHPQEGQSSGDYPLENRVCFGPLLHPNPFLWLLR